MLLVTQNSCEFSNKSYLRIGYKPDASIVQIRFKLRKFFFTFGDAHCDALQ